MAASSQYSRAVLRLLNYSEEMKVAEATALICTPLVEWARPQSWCDLGSGKGTFTIALAQLLTPGSTIYAIDFDQRALEGIPDQYDGVEIRKIAGGRFARIAVETPDLDSGQRIEAIVP